VSSPVESLSSNPSRSKSVCISKTVNTSSSLVLLTPSNSRSFFCTSVSSLYPGVNSISTFNLSSETLSKFFLADENFSLILTRLFSLPLNLF